MNQGVVDWVRAATPPEVIRGKTLLDVGCADWNGSMRDYFVASGVLKYHGVDILEAPNVDEVLDARKLVETYGSRSWDIVICLEMLEHAEYWQDCLYQMKEVLVEGGSLLLSTRVPGYARHASPDWWRYSKELLHESLSDMADVAIWSDPGEFDDETRTYYVGLGIFARARRAGSVTVPTGEAEKAPPLDPEVVDPVMRDVLGK